VSQLRRPAGVRRQFEIGIWHGRPRRTELPEDNPGVATPKKKASRARFQPDSAMVVDKATGYKKLANGSKKRKKR
jgi:hypothetical protein